MQEYAQAISRDLRRAAASGPSGHERCGAAARCVNRDMGRRSSTGEIILGVVVVTLVAFVGSQVIASPRRLSSDRAGVLSSRDSAAIAEQYRAQLESRRGSYVVSDWLRAIHIARLQAAAERDVTGLDPLPSISPDSTRALLASGESGTYIRAMLAEDENIITRWAPRAQPIRVWVQPQSAEQGFTPDLIIPTRRAFSAWNEVGLGVSFETVDDSSVADVHVTWRNQMIEARQIGTTFRMTGGRGWISFAHVVLSTAYDIYAVQNAARHEAGHVLGLGHSPDLQDIMASATEGKQYQITDADRRTALLLYQLPPGKIE